MSNTSAPSGEVISAPALDVAGSREGWREGGVVLAYRLGARTLASASLRLLISGTPFVDRPALADPMPPASALPRGRDGFFLPSQPVSGRLPGMALMSGYIRFVRAQYPRYFADLTGGPGAHLAALPGKTRQELRRYVRRFEKHCGGRIDFRVYATGAEIAEFYRLARELSALTYQERTLDVGLPADEAFRADLLQKGERGLARGYLLFCEGRAVSYLLAFADGDTLYWQRMGYDPKYEDLSPGTVLVTLIFDHLLEMREFRQSDHGEGEGLHKRRYATGQRFCADVFFLRRTLRNAVIATSYLAVDAISLHAGAALERLGLKARIRRLLRGA